MPTVHVHIALEHFMITARLERSGTERTSFRFLDYADGEYA